jgi:succinoglycan biosynthesis protein ExoA
MTDQLTDLHPFVTVILPIRNEANFIERSLGAVLRQDYPSNRMEVIVADGNSTDDTRLVIAQLVDEVKVAGPCAPVLVIDNAGGIVATGLNAALKRASGDIVVRVDGHTVIATDYVRQCVEALARTGAENVGGRMDPVSTSSFGQAVAIATSSPFGVGGARFHYSTREEWVDTVYMGAWRKQTFDRIGMFDEELVRNQDDEFNYRLLSHGGRILLSQQIRSHYYNRSTLKTLSRQYFQYGYWKVRVMQKHPRQMRLRQFIPAAFVLVLFLGSAFAPLSGAFGYGALACVAAYLILNLSASLLSVAKHGWNHVALLPGVFATLHFSYGLGFIVGTVRFANRWKTEEPSALGEEKIEHHKEATSQNTGGAIP